MSFGEKLKNSPNPNFFSFSYNCSGSFVHVISKYVIFLLQCLPWASSSFTSLQVLYFEATSFGLNLPSNHFCKLPIRCPLNVYLQLSVICTDGFFSNSGLPSVSRFANTKYIAPTRQLTSCSISANVVVSTILE